ncbi:hypothetical protein KQI38_05460 [Tissierella carlieri]|uniref:hypothetical protein n=1 Tax=Tissierella carlieri TaxID=689904 RepID=UPI001C114BA8|nr:hypothetical protein [Tissierella carlieri]MBU5311468.1 hypothetical protein [Tissierella carlieri]
MFIEKLNRKQSGVYVLEEEKTVINGIWEGYLDHDNVNHKSISIYTGSKLTGEKVENCFISTPSEAPWKTHIKIFSSSPKVYVVYESTGDQVEAEDINELQDELVNEINRATTAEQILGENLNAEILRSTNAENLLNNNLNNEITRAKGVESGLESKKSDKTYVDIELNKKADKFNTYTKEETDSRIQKIVGAAPEALDTLQEIAIALNNDKDFAGTMTNELAKKVDKVPGKGLSDENYTATEKSKLAGIAENANNYVHPSTHPASMIIESSTKRFITDTERSNWNDANSKKHEHSNKTVIDKITQALLDAWDSAVTHISDTIKHITSTERAKWNTVDNKADKTYVDNTFATKQDLGNAGYGDMLKSVYDTNNDGKVDKAGLADSVPWSGVTGKPSTFSPSTHSHDSISVVDTRSINETPAELLAGGRILKCELKSRAIIGNPPVNACANSSYAHLITIVGWSNSSGGYPVQVTFGKSSMAIRIGISDTAWSSWMEYRTITGGVTWNDLKGV